MLEDSGVSSKVINLALKASKETIDNLKIGTDGKFENATEVEKASKKRMPTILQPKRLKALMYRTHREENQGK